ncbi:MAG: sigma-54-dependent Fis family transcriptional regulator, partial [Sphingomonadales bacterium]|nr:sigma-54-dependent Fis family transcriptional regulator [Sphingomonadales bacterium]
MRGTILIVDDEATQLRIMESVLTRMGFNVRTASDGEEALNILKQVSGDEITLMILDLSMPRVSGMDVLKTIRPLRPELPIIVLTSHSSLSTAVEVMRAGANDFISKPASAERIRTAITSVLDKDQLVGEIEAVSKALADTQGFDDLVGSCKAFLDAVRMAKKSVRAKIPVLIEGESGVGKELFARAIQKASDRADKPFITVNCGAIPENLVESILFGHEKGA